MKLLLFTMVVPGMLANPSLLSPVQLRLPEPKGNPFLTKYQPKRLTDCPVIIPLSPIPSLNAPSWLSVGSSSGIVTGTPPSAGSYTFDVKAQNTLGSNVQIVTLSVSDYSDWQYALSITTDLGNGTTLKDWNMLVRLSETDTNGTGNRGFPLQSGTIQWWRLAFS